MSLRIYNTLTGAKEEFIPLHPPKVGMYVCGVTVYDDCHIGHARSGVVFDVIYRYLRFRGYEVTYVRNFTDIDDKIINRANELGIPWNELAERYIAAFHRDMGALGLLPPTIEPKATGHIGEMLEMIQTLIARGMAYELHGSVYFSVKSFPEYGRLSKKNIDDLQAGARVEVDEEKRDPLDFALWKASKPGEPMWDSPWGKGRPGWHIECSAMGRKYLGVTFDIHGGGKDLVFPHHENEIAQSHGCSGAEPVKIWAHNGFVNVNAEKMSKSLGNFWTIKDALARCHPEALRLFLISSHYRSPIDFTPQSLGDATKNLARFYDLLDEPLSGEERAAKGDEALTAGFTAAMDDDFNTAAALGVLNTALRHMNQLRAESARMKRSSDAYKSARAQLARGIAALREAGGVLGLFTLAPGEFLERFRNERLAGAGMTREALDGVIAQRAAARAGKDYAESDRIREELAVKGILVQDTPGGAVWTASLD